MRAAGVICPADDRDRVFRERRCDPHLDEETARSARRAGLLERLAELVIGLHHRGREHRVHIEVARQDAAHRRVWVAQIGPLVGLKLRCAARLARIVCRCRHPDSAGIRVLDEAAHGQPARRCGTGQRPVFSPRTAGFGHMLRGRLATLCLPNRRPQFRMPRPLRPATGLQLMLWIDPRCARGRVPFRRRLDDEPGILTFRAEPRPHRIRLDVFKCLEQVLPVPHDVIERLVLKHRTRPTAMFRHPSADVAFERVQNLRQRAPLPWGRFQRRHQHVHVIRHADRRVKAERLAVQVQAAFHHDVAFRGRQRAFGDAECDEVACARALNVGQVPAKVRLVADRRAARSGGRSPSGRKTGPRPVPHFRSGGLVSLRP